MPSGTGSGSNPGDSSRRRSGGGDKKVLGPAWGSVPDLRKIKLKVLEGRELARKDIFGASDPYVRVDLVATSANNSNAAAVDSLTTTTKKRTLNPKWNEEFTVHVSPYIHKRIQLNVFDENRITRDDFLGLVDLELVDLPTEATGQTVSEATHFLKPRSSKSKVKGFLKVYAAYLPREDEAQNGSADGDTTTNSGTATATESSSSANNTTSSSSQDSSAAAPENGDSTFQGIEAIGETPPVETHDLPEVPSRAGEGGTESLQDMPNDTIDPSDLESVRDMPEESFDAADVERVDDSSLESPLALPTGWEEREDANGRTFYVNHTDRTTQWEHPATTRNSSSGRSGLRARSGSRSSVAGGGAAARGAAGATASEQEFNRRHHISVEDEDRSPSPRSGDDEGASSVAADTDEVVDQLSRQSVSEGDAAASSSPSASSAPAANGGDDNPLPHGWTMKKAPNGRVFFIDHSRKTTTWKDPRTGKPSASVGGSAKRRSSRSTSSRVGKHENGLGPLPAGWEERVHKDGRTFFIDHNNKTTSWEDPRLSDPNISGPAVPYSRDYKWKYDYLKSQLRRPAHLPKQFKMKVRRRHIFEDSFQQLQMSSSRVDVLKAGLWIEFDNESGLDYGGVAREWFYLLSKEMFNPYYGFFEYSAIDNYTLQINPYSGQCNEDHLKYFRFIGRVAGMAVYHGKLLDGFFIRPFYKMMLGKDMTLQDMEAVDNLYYNSLVWIKDNDPEDLELTFQVEEEKFGAKVAKELKPGGANIPVTEENKAEYVQAVINWRFVHRVAPQMEAFKNGFNEIVPLHLLRIFDEGELELLLGGIGAIDVRDWRRHTVYKGDYHANHLVIQWFWRLVLSFNNEMRARLLQFVTGTSRVPMNGFKELYGSNGPKLFTIERWGHPDSYPRAHTCFNRLDLPPYESYEVLKEKLIGAVEGSVGFEGVD